MTRSRLPIAITAWLIAATVVCSPALADSSSASAYGGQGQSISQIGLSTPISIRPSPQTPGGTLPFTGLDLALVFGAALVLIAASAFVRWHLHRSGRGGESA
jgi:hypothetical protein